MKRIIPIVVLALIPVAVQAAGQSRQDAILAALSAQAAATASAERGEALFRGRFAGGDARTPSCTACHTDDPRQVGRNAKTGRPIDPLAVSANPSRFSEEEQVNKHFVRDCKSVLGRECSAQEKADFTAFMVSQ